MALALDTSSTGGSNTGASLTWSHTCTGSDLILFVACLGGGGEGDRISGVTYNGDALTKIDGATEPGDNTYVSLWYLINPDTGANNVVVSLSPNGYIKANAASYTGALQSDQPDSSNTATQTDNASITVSTTTVDDNCWAVLATSARVTVTAVSGCTKRQETLFDSNGAITPAQSYSMTVGGGDGGTDWAVVIASFSPQTTSTSTSTTSTSTSTSTSTTSTSTSTTSTSTSTSTTTTSTSTSSSTSTTSTTTSTSTTTTSTSTTSTSTTTTFPFNLKVEII